MAALIYTSGTTGTPKGVMLSHENITALVASLAPLFPLSKGDRVLSVLPLHHTFELTCGMLLPLSRGARVVYLDELTAERLEAGLKSGRITAMIGVPALWEMLERRISARVAERGALASHVFDFAVELNRTLGKSLGVDAGKLLFGPVHTGLGGHLRYLVSGGAALPEKTHHLFSGMGLHLAEGYGLTEAAPVLTVSASGPKSKPGHVGKPVPGVEIRISGENADGVGEVLARGPNVMLGYSDDEETTRRVIDSEGWLHTGRPRQARQEGQPRHRWSGEGHHRHLQRREHLPGRRGSAHRPSRARGGIRHCGRVGWSRRRAGRLCGGGREGRGQRLAASGTLAPSESSIGRWPSCPTCSGRPSSLWWTASCRELRRAR